MTDIAANCGFHWMFCTVSGLVCMSVALVVSVVVAYLTDREEDDNGQHSMR